MLLLLYEDYMLVLFIKHTELNKIQRDYTKKIIIIFNSLSMVY